MLGALFAAAVLQDQQGLPLAVAEGGFCTGIAWISADASPKLSVDDGPDFRVYRYDGEGGDWWGVYSGRFAQVSDGKRRLFFKRDGVRVESITVDGKFRGYLATDRDGWQNHFFGAPFKNAASDMAFFAQVDFGPAGLAKCKRHPG